jgi:hypothetical protein
MRNDHMPCSARQRASARAARPRAFLCLPNPGGWFDTDGGTNAASPSLRDARDGRAGLALAAERSRGSDSWNRRLAPRRDLGSVGGSHAAQQRNAEFLLRASDAPRRHDRRGRRHRLAHGRTREPRLHSVHSGRPHDALLRDAPRTRPAGKSRPLLRSLRGGYAHVAINERVAIVAGVRVRLKSGRTVPIEVVDPVDPGENTWAPEVSDVAAALAGQPLELPGPR